MPYSVVKQGNVWKLKNKDTGKIKGIHSTKAKALKQARLLYGLKSGSIKKPRKSNINIASVMGWRE